MIDYALPTILAEKALAALHDAMLRRQYAEAKKQAVEALEQTMNILEAIKHMETKQFLSDNRK